MAYGVPATPPIPLRFSGWRNWGDWLPRRKPQAEPAPVNSRVLNTAESREFDQASHAIFRILRPHNPPPLGTIRHAVGRITTLVNQRDVPVHQKTLALHDVLTAFENLPKPHGSVEFPRGTLQAYAPLLKHLLQTLIESGVDMTVPNPRKVGSILKPILPFQRLLEIVIDQEDTTLLPLIALAMRTRPFSPVGDYGIPAKRLRELQRWHPEDYAWAIPLARALYATMFANDPHPTPEKDRLRQAFSTLFDPPRLG